MSKVLFPAWKPDFAELGNSTTMQNVFRRKDGTFGHVKALVEIGSALNGPCRGAASFYLSDGTITTVAGTATKLYIWDGIDTWDDATRLVGGAYTIAAEHRWVFTQDEDKIYADNGIDAPQVLTGGGTNFAAASGSPPTCRFTAKSDNGFFFRAHTTNDNREEQWSSQFDSDEWIVGTNQGDSQIFPEGGRITGLVGGEFILTFQEQKIRRGFYAAGDVIFEISQVSTQRGCTLPGTIASFERTTVFRANDGFYRIDGGQTMTRIGDGVDDEFLNNLDQSNLNSIWAIIDPLRPFLLMAWPTADSTADTLWICNLELGSDGWTPCAYDIECLFTMYPDVSIDLDTDSGEAGDSDLDTPGLPSLDSDQYRGTPNQIVAAFSSNHKLAFFSGSSLEGTLDTEEAQLGEGFEQVEVDRVIPLVSGGDATISPQAKLGYRNRQQDAVTYSSAVTADSQGDVWFREPPARFQRLRTILPAGSNFTHAVGADFLPSEGGDR